MNIDNNSPAALKPRNIFIGICIAFVFCITSHNDLKDAETMAAAKKDAQAQAYHEATVNAKARQISEAMIAEANHDK